MKKTITKTLQDMTVGQLEEFTAEESMTVRSMASMLGFKWGRVYKTAQDRDRKKLMVIRIS